MTTGWATTTRDGMGIAAIPDLNGRAMTDRVLPELAGRRGRLSLVIEIGTSRPRMS
jgi:hypothetical protein